MLSLFVLNLFLVCVSTSTLVWDTENGECLVCGGFVNIEAIGFPLSVIEAPSTELAQIPSECSN